MNTRSIALLHTCAAALLLAGCGGSGSDDTAGSGSETGDTATTGPSTQDESGSATMTGDGDGDPTGDGDGDGDPGDGDGDPTGDGDGDGDPTGDGDGDGDGDPTGDGDGDECVPTEMVEVTCDNIDNNCDGLIDNVDQGNDGFCDCLVIGILGAPGYSPTSEFEAYLEEQGTTVTRTLLNQPNIVTPEFLAPYDVILIDRIQRGLSPAEATAIEDFVKDGGFGVITLIGYNFDNGNPGPERDRANTVLAPFGLAYQGGYIHAGGGQNVTPTFDQNHPVSMGIMDVNFAGGIEPVDNGNQGMSSVFATVPQGDAGLAHETDMGGRLIVWGDEWLTFDSDWQGYADVQSFWAQMLSWVKPQDFCADPQ